MEIKNIMTKCNFIDILKTVFPEAPRKKKNDKIVKKNIKKNKKSVQEGQYTNNSSFVVYRERVIKDLND